MNLAKELTDLKLRIEEKEKEHNEAKAQLKVLMKGLKDEFGLDSLEEAKKELKSLTKQENDLKLKIENAIRSIEDEYNI